MRLTAVKILNPQNRITYSLPINYSARLELYMKERQQNC